MTANDVSEENLDVAAAAAGKCDDPAKPGSRWLTIFGKGLLYVIGWGRYVAQFLICCWLAITLQIIATSILHQQVTKSVEAYIPGRVKEANAKLEKYNVSLCISVPTLDALAQGCPTTEKLQGGEQATPPRWFGLEAWSAIKSSWLSTKGWSTTKTVWFSLEAHQLKAPANDKPADSTKPTENTKPAESTKPQEAVTLERASIVFLQDEKTWGLISNPKIVESIHSMSRVVERTSQARRDINNARLDWTTNLRLCAGTPRLWDDGNCTAIESALQDLSERIDGILDSQRLWVMFFGTIQAFVLSVFLFILVEAAILACDLFITPAPLFFKKEATKLTLKTGPEFHEAMSDYLSSRRRHVLDSLVIRILFSAGQSGGSNLRSDGTSAEAFREFQVGEADAPLSGLDVGNEILLKLSFAGTIWGIGSALFYARNLDSLDPIERIIAKAAMFSGIGTGFGTTLVGILLSMVASIVIQALSGSWHRHVNSSYKFVIDLGSDQITSQLPYVTNQQRAGVALNRQELRPDVFEAIGRLGIRIGLFVALGWIAYAYRADLYAWSRMLIERIGGLI